MVEKNRTQESVVMEFASLQIILGADPISDPDEWHLLAPVQEKPIRELESTVKRLIAHFEVEK